MKEYVHFMDAQSQPRNYPGSENFAKLPKKPVSRRALLKLGLLGGSAAAVTLVGIDTLVWAPMRAAKAITHASVKSDIQFDIGNFLAPIQSLDGVLFHFGPVFTVFLTAQLTATPDRFDQQDLADALGTIERVYPWSPGGIFTFVSYGLPYFNRLPGDLVSGHMPRLASDQSRFALEEAVPGLSDVSSRNPVIHKETFNVPVRVESNDVLFSFRSDHLSNITETVNWLLGSDELGGFSLPSPDFAFNGLLNFTTIRTMFVQIGLPRRIANSHGLSFAGRVNPRSPMWMGFADQQVAGSGPATITTFQGNASSQLTTAVSGDYFDNGTVQHLSHVIQDLPKFYADNEPFTERVQYMFRSDPIPSLGNADQLKDGGGGAFFENNGSIFLKYQAQGTTEAIQTALAFPNPVNDPQPPTSPNPDDIGKRNPRMGHLSALQQVSRAADGTALHVRMDGPGFSAGDVPDGSRQAKLQFSVFVPTSDFFQRLRDATAAQNFQQIDPLFPGRGGSPHGTVGSDDNGLERFLTATRRQNFLMPPRRHRAFPLVEFTDSSTKRRARTSRKPSRKITVL
jgi:hypothetical protein